MWSLLEAYLLLLLLFYFFFILSNISLDIVLYDFFLQLFTQNYSYLYDPTNETTGVFVPAQILYDAFHGRYHSATGAIILLFVIWGSFFFGGLSITTSAARVVSGYHFLT